MSATPTDVGMLLKQERERKGIALDVVHEATKVPMDALRAIEEGYKVRTLTAFYYKSFVKIYAQYLGLDANHVVSLIPTHHPKPSVSTSSVYRSENISRPKPVTGAGAQAVEGVRSGNLFAHPIILKKKKKILKFVLLAVAAVVIIVLAVVLIRKVSAFIKSRPVKTTVTKVKPKPEPRKVLPAADIVTKQQPKPVENKPTAAVEKNASEPKPLSVVEKKVAENKPAEGLVKTEESKPLPATAAPSPVNKQVSMTVKAKTTTWIRIDVDDTGTVFQGRVKKGSAPTFRGTKKIVLSANDIGALELEVNGRSVGSLASNYLKAKRVVVTPLGLTVDK